MSDTANAPVSQIALPKMKGKTLGNAPSLPTSTPPANTDPAPAPAPTPTPEPPAPEPSPAPAPAPAAVTPPTPAPTPVPPTPAATVPPAPAPAPQAGPEVIKIDPNAIYETPQGTRVRGATLSWAEGLQAKTDREKTAAKKMQASVEDIAAEAARKTAEEVLKHIPQTPATPAPSAAPSFTPEAFTEPEPVAPKDAYEDSKEYKEYKEAHSDWKIRKAIHDATQKGLAAGLAPVRQMQEEQQRTRAEEAQRREIYGHNAKMLNTQSVALMAENLGIDFSTLSPQDKQDVLYRITNAAAAKGIPLDREGKLDIERYPNKITEDKLDAIIGYAFNDGWRPSASTAAPAPAPTPAPVPAIDPMDEMAKKLLNGESAAAKAPTPEPLVPAAAPSAAIPGQPRPAPRGRAFTNKVEQLLGKAV